MSELHLCLQPEVLAEQTPDLRVWAGTTVQVSTLRLPMQEVSQRLRARSKTTQGLRGVRDRHPQGHPAEAQSDLSRNRLSRAILNLTDSHGL